MRDRLLTVRGDAVLFGMMVSGTAVHSVEFEIGRLRSYMHVLLASY
jgi:hypothetical protein